MTPLGFFRIERIVVLKMRTWFALLKLAKNNLREENHVHQLTLSFLWHSWLRVSSNRVCRGPHDLHHRATPRPSSLSHVRLAGGPRPGARRPAPADRADRPEADLRLSPGAPRDLF